MGKFVRLAPFCSGVRIFFCLAPPERLKKKQKKSSTLACSAAVFNLQVLSVSLCDSYVILSIAYQLDNSKTHRCALKNEGVPETLKGVAEDFAAPAIMKSDGRQEIR